MTSAFENHLWQSTLFACVVAVLTLTLRRHRAAVRHGLWLAASMKFLIPFSLLIGIGSHVEWRRATEVTQPQSVMQEISQPFTSPASHPPAAPAPLTSSRLPALLFGVWLCGFAANSLAWWQRWRRVRAAVRSASALDLNLPIRVMSSPAGFEPGVFGIRKPILLLPESLTERLTPPQFAAVVAHELCHVRRRDNLTAAIHMVVEALFWFHPLVWWIERRLVEERERACDEEVLRMATDPQVYAEGIVNVCKFYLESPLVSVSGVTGANLKRRVEAIMENRGASKLNFGRKLLLAGAGTLAVAGPLAVGLLNAPRVRGQSQFRPPTQSRPTPPLVAQTLAPQGIAPQVARQAPTQSTPLTPAFESASIKRGNAANWLAPNINDQWLEFEGTVASLTQWAYGLPRDFQISGGPAWLGVRDFQNEWHGVELFDIHATAGRPSSEAEMKQMVQTLLADRFKLKLHRETREIPIYALVVGPNGPHLVAGRESDCAGFAGECGFPNIGGPEGGVHSITSAGGTMAGFAMLLTNNVDRPVVDQTNLTGGYDFILPYEHSGPGWRTGSAIFGPIQTLGLRLEPQTETFEQLVIDSVDHPVEN